MVVFFYGLFMDTAVLEGKGVRALDPQVARLEGYRLVIGARATLVPAPGETVYGVAMRVPAEDLERLYSDPSVGAYRPEAVRVVLGDGRQVDAVCYNLPPPVERAEPDRAYARRLRELARRLGLPEAYRARIEPAGSVLALLGDSILDNGPYVAPRPDTAEHLRRLLGPEWAVHLLARDGSVMADVHGQLGALPKATDAAVLSVGGNDAIEHIDLLTRPASSAAEVLADLGAIAHRFAARYDALLGEVAARVPRVIVCTIYEPPLHDREVAELARVPVALLDERIIRSASRRALEVVDLRTVCTGPEDFVQQIEPSPTGARKIAEAIARVVQGATRAGRIYAF